MQLSDFDYDLPESLIAQHPSSERTASRLLVLEEGDSYRDAHFSDLPELLHAGDLLVFNDTRVMQARLFGRKETGGRLELLVERVLEPGLALAHIKASKSPKPGSAILLGDDEWQAHIAGRRDQLFEVQLDSGDFQTLMQRRGHLPLPPYIERSDSAQDQERYQTVYASKAGAVAAPTAGLHFDLALLQSLEERGIESAHVTLHVGAGTFQPVRVENLDLHQMHSEYLEVDDTVCRQVMETRARGGRVIAVGTTCVRSLETASRSGQIGPYQGDTRLFIRPGYNFKSVDGLITNFHLPKSTLLMLVSAFAGHGRIMGAYRHAIREKYRFFSYGDAMFILP
jgi:S-adenosylmethionine:tRNA ribosyltransferase-isomerase